MGNCGADCAHARDHDLFEGVTVAWILVFGLLFFAVAALNAQGATLGGSTEQIYEFHWASDESQVNAWAQSASDQSGVSVARIKAIIYIESRGNPNAQNPSDPSYGLMALEVPTASYYAGQDVTPDQLLNDPQLNANLGAAFLAHLQDRYDGSFPFGQWAWAYNEGEPAFDRGRQDTSYGAKVREIRTGNMVFLGPGELEQAFS